MLTIDRWQEAPNDGLVLSLAFADHAPAAGNVSDFRAALQSRPGEVALTFGPSHQVEHWPALACRHAIYGADGASLTLRLDPGADPEPMPGRMSAFAIGGRSERRSLLAILRTLSAELDVGIAGGDLRLRQATDVIASLAGWIEQRQQLAGTRLAQPLAAKPDLFAPSFCGTANVDDVLVSEAWSHLRLGYVLPRLNGIWTRKVTWRVFCARRRFGLEFRALEGDHPPIDLLETADIDEHGPVLRAEMSLDDPLSISSSVARLHPNQKAMIVAIARQTALDLPQALARRDDAPPFSRERWRHWSRVLPDVLARVPVDA